MANNLKADPSRTMGIQRQWMAETNRRFRWLRGKVWELLVKDDAFGLIDPNVTTNQENFRFTTDERKITAFRNWLVERINEGILTTTAAGNPWMAQYVQAAHTKGMRRAYSQVRPQIQEPGMFQGGVNEFVTSLSGPETVSKVQMLATRSFEELRGVTASMGQQMNRVMADSLSQGWGARRTARTLNETVSGITQRRAMLIARTETVRAHAEGQLDAFEALGVEELGVEVEWSTAGDGRVCQKCAEMEGKTYKVEKARGLIPRHPACRCVFVPSLEENR